MGKLNHFVVAMDIAILTRHFQDVVIDVTITRGGGGGGAVILVKGLVCFSC